MKALLVGAGGMGRTWAKNLIDYDAVTLSGWVDIRADAAQEAAETLSLPHIHTGDDLERAIRLVRPDFVVDVTIPEAHHEVTLTALRLGVPVLGEKPLAASMAQAREMVAASEASGKLYMVSQSRRYDANLLALRRLIDREVGPLGLLNSDFYIGAHFGGFRDEMPSPLLLDMAIHTFDQARALSGADPVSVFCDEFNPGWSWYAGAPCANVLFQMTGGLRYTYRGSWCAEGSPTSWQGEWRAVGPHGTALWDGDHAPTAQIVVAPDGFQSRTEPRTESPDTDAPSGIAGSLRDFVQSLQTGQTPMGECHDNLKSLAMVFAAIESSRTGRCIPVEI